LKKPVFEINIKDFFNEFLKIKKPFGKRTRIAVQKDLYPERLCG